MLILQVQIKNFETIVEKNLDSIWFLRKQKLARTHL